MIQILPENFIIGSRFAIIEINVQKEISKQTYSIIIEAEDNLKKKKLKSLYYEKNNIVLIENLEPNKVYQVKLRGLLNENILLDSEVFEIKSYKDKEWLEIIDKIYFNEKQNLQNNLESVEDRSSKDITENPNVDVKQNPSDYNNLDSIDIDIVQ